MLLSSYPLDDADNERIASVCRQHGIEFCPASGDRDERIAQIDRDIERAEIFLGGRLTAEQFARASSLRWIHVPWAGVNALFAVEAIRESSVLVSNASGIMADSVADQVMAYLLLFSRQLLPQLDAMKRHEWMTQSVERTERRILRDATIGIIGFGSIGRAVARRARAFGMRVVAVRRTTARTDSSVDMVVTNEQLPMALGEADYVVIALPLTDQTRGMFGRAEFATMKRSAILVNISRGGIVVQSDLLDALRAGTIAGAALDVFDTEPLPPESPLWSMRNVIATPHSSGGFDRFRTESATLFIDNLHRFLAGGPLANVVDPHAGY